MSFVVVAEILRVEVRSILFPLEFAVMWLVNFGLTEVYSTMLEQLHKYGTFWTSSGICVLGLLYIIKFIPETKGKDPDEIERFFFQTSPVEKERKQSESSTDSFKQVELKVKKLEA